METPLIPIHLIFCDPSPSRSEDDTDGLLLHFDVHWPAVPRVGDMVQVGAGYFGEDDVIQLNEQQVMRRRFVVKDVVWTAMPTKGPRAWGGPTPLIQVTLHALPK